MYVVGKTGKGKSKFLQHCLYQDIVEGRGCAVIDPHSDLVDDLLSTLQANGMLENPQISERIIYLNPAQHDYIIPFNVLETPGEPYEVVQNVIEAFRRAWPEALENAPHFSNVMLYALLLLIRMGRRLNDLPMMLLQQDVRDQWLEWVHDRELTLFFHERFDKWGKQAPLMKESTLNKVTALTMNPHLRLMLGQPENRLNFRQIMDEGKVLLADLGHCDEESQRLIGNLITTGFEQAAFSRHDQPTSRRRPFYLYIDEFHDFSASAHSNKSLSKILSGARKFGLHLTLVHQNLGQLSPRVQSVVLGNAWTKVIFGVSEADAHEFARLIGLGNFDLEAIKHDAQTSTQHPLYEPLTEHTYEWATALANQKPRQAIVRDHSGRTKQIWTFPIAQLESDYRDFIEANLKQHGEPYVKVEPRLIWEAMRWEKRSDWPSYEAKK